jgi:L-malate glycosyltransferase
MKIMKKTILVLTSTFPRWKKDHTPGFVYDLSNRIAAKNSEVIVLAPHAYKAAKMERLGKLRVHRFQYFYPKKLQKVAYEGGVLLNVKNSLLAKVQLPFFLASEIFSAINLVKKYDVSLIHAHWIIPQGVVGWMLKKFYRIPLIVTVHGSDLFPLKHPVYKYFQEKVLNVCDVCTVNSKSTKNEIVKRFPKFTKKIYVIPMGVDFKLFSRRSIGTKKGKYSDKKIILYVGRLNEQKGLKYLIEAMVAVKNRFPKAILLIIGEGAYKSELEKILKSAEMEDYVEFLGGMNHDKIAEYYNLSDVFVLPSIESKIGTEGQGLVLIEAMASKVPVIGTNTGGIRFLVKNNVDGILVKQKSSEEIANAITRLLTNNGLSNKLTENAFKFTKDSYSWDSISEKFNELYKELK